MTVTNCKFSKYCKSQIDANGNGTINGQDDQVFLIDPYSSITLVSFEDDWRIVNVSPGLRLLSNVDFNTPDDAIARRELKGISDLVTANTTAEPGEFIRVSTNGQQLLYLQILYGGIEF